MKIKKYLAFLASAMIMMTAFTACSGDSSESSVSEDGSSEGIVHEAPETAPQAANGDVNADSSADDDSSSALEIPPADDVNFEPANSAASGQAYLAIVDSKWWVQYWGSAEKDGYMLAYNAGIADIHGDGSYKVSVTADTNGFRYDTTGSPDEQYTPEGLSFLSVMIPDGETAYPGAVITIDSVVVDGTELELSAKNYTSSDDGAETRANIYNSYVTTPPDDARTSEGALYDEEGKALSIRDNYSAQIVDPEAFSSWTTVEVNFTITGTNSGTPAPAAEESDAVSE